MQKVKLNIVPKGVKKTTYLSQNDNGRVVRYELFNELIPYILDGSETITVKVVRPDGEEILESIENTFEGKAYIDVSFNDDMSAITGVGAGEIKITDGETELGSHNFDINVEIDAYNGKDVVIETETGTLLSFNTEVEDNALEYESEIPYNAEGYTGLRVINSRTAPVYNKTPYLFRKTPSGYGNSCIEKLNGLTVAFNQMASVRDSISVNGVTATRNNDNSWNISGEASAEAVLNLENGGANFNLYNDHVYFIAGTFTGGSNSKYGYGIGGLLLDFGGGTVWKNTNHYTRGFSGFVVRNGVTVSLTNVFFRIHDLTQMFGSTIADYIYSLETAQAGAGVAYFKALFGADYYPVNAGELMSVKTSGRKTIGFNQWNESIQVGRWSNIVGQKCEIVVDNTRFCNSTPIKILPNTEYYFNTGNYGACIIMVCDNEMTVLQVVNTAQSNIFTTPANANFLCFYPYTIGQTFNKGICVNISDSERNGQYEPYNAVTYPLDPDLELRGIPKLDANNKLYGDGDIYESSGDVTRRYGVINLGSIAWTFIGGSYNEFATTTAISGIKTQMAYNPNAFISKKYTVVAWHPENEKTAYFNNNGVLYIMDNDYSDATVFKNSLDGVYLIYELATPTSESADPFTDPQEARVTEEFIDERSIPIPVGHDTIYGTDIEYQDIDFDTTIFGGEIDAVNGVLSSEYNSDGSVKPTPEVIDITPILIPVKAGDNKIFNSANGNQTIRYYNQVEE